MLLKSTPHLPNTTQRDTEVGDIILHTNTRNACSRLVSHVSPLLLSRHWNPRGVYEGGRMGEERRAMKEKEGK